MYETMGEGMQVFILGNFYLVLLYGSYERPPITVSHNIF